MFTVTLTVYHLHVYYLPFIVYCYGLLFSITAPCYLLLSTNSYSVYYLLYSSRLKWLYHFSIIAHVGLLSLIRPVNGKTRKDINPVFKANLTI